MSSPVVHHEYPGLNAAQVEESRRKHGANVLTPPEREPWWKQFLEKFDDPVIRILIIAAVISMAVGHLVEGVGIIIAILLATTLAFLNEYRANREFDILNKVNDDVPIKVIRDGHYMTVPRRDIVVGDIMLVEVGEESAADGIVFEAVSLQVDESRLTGESLPVTKYSKDSPDKTSVKEAAYPADRIMRGTMIADGHGIVEVSAVGDNTDIGKTLVTATEEKDSDTPLNQQLDKLSKLIGIVGLGVAILTFFALVGRGAVKGETNLTGAQWAFATIMTIGVFVAMVRVWLPMIYDGFEVGGIDLKPPAWLEKDDLKGWLTTVGIGVGVMLIGVIFAAIAIDGSWLSGNGEKFLLYFMIAVTIIVVAVPEGLAMSVTLSLAYSMRKMTATNNLVRKMHACETIGAATVICSDKTGTLTMNEMRVHEVKFPAFDGQFGQSENLNETERLIAESISANSTAQLNRAPGEPVKAIGNPTEGALLLWLEASKVDYIYHRTEFPIVYQWTFSTERKYMGTLGESAALKVRTLHVKGAPEIVMARCNRIRTAQGVEPLDAHRERIQEELKSYQARGMRTLGFAYHEAPPNHEGVDIEHVASDMVWLGFAAIADPVRPEVPLAIQACRDAGILVKMVTGDNSETALEISRQISLVDDKDGPGSHLTGVEFGQLADEKAGDAVVEMKVLSRARPMDKLRLVRLLQEKGHVVAVTGDGTNDAPALNHANVGLAMGKTGTAVAKEASDIILLDDSFRSIVNAVMWGRSLYENIQRFILFQLTINVAALGIAFLGPFIGVKLPLTVTQMLWVNLIMDTFAALALATEPPHESVMKRKPRDSKDFIVSGPMAKSIFLWAGAFLIVMIGMLLIFKKEMDASEKQATWEGSVFFAVFVLLQFWNLFNARCLGRTDSAFTGILENKAFLMIASAILVGQILITQFGGEVFRTMPLSFLDWFLILLTTSVVLWVGEGLRWLERKKEREQASLAPAV